MAHLFGRTQTQPPAKKIGTYRIHNYSWEKVPVGHFGSKWDSKNYPVSVVAHVELKQLSGAEARIEDYYNIRLKNVEERHKKALDKAIANHVFSQKIRDNQVTKPPPTLSSQLIISPSTSPPVTGASQFLANLVQKGKTPVVSNPGVSNPFTANTQQNKPNIFAMPSSTSNSTTQNTSNPLLSNPLTNPNVLTPTSTNPFGNSTNQNSQGAINNPFMRAANPNPIVSNLVTPASIPTISTPNTQIKNIFSNPNTSTIMNVSNAATNNGGYTPSPTLQNLFENSITQNTSTIPNNPFNNSGSSATNNSLNSSSNTSKNIFNTSATANIVKNTTGASNTNSVNFFNNANNLSNNNSNSLNPLFTNNPNVNPSANNALNNNSSNTSVSIFSNREANTQNCVAPTSYIVVPIPSKLIDQSIKHLSFKMTGQTMKQLLAQEQQTVPRKDSDFSLKEQEPKGVISSYSSVYNSKQYEKREKDRHEKQTQRMQELLKKAKTAFRRNREGQAKEANKSASYPNGSKVQPLVTKGGHSLQGSYDPYQQLEKYNQNRPKPVDIVFTQTYTVDGKFESQRIETIPVMLPFDQEKLKRIIEKQAFYNKLIKPLPTVQIVRLQVEQRPFEVVCKIDSRIINVPSGYYFSYKKLENNVATGLKIGNDLGELEWLEDIDVSNIDFSQAIEITDRRISFFKDLKRPPAGTGLNRPCIFTKFSCDIAAELREEGMYQIELVQMHLKALCQKRLVKYVDYNPDNDHWRIRFEAK